MATEVINGPSLAEVANGSKYAACDTFAPAALHDRFPRGSGVNSQLCYSINTMEAAERLKQIDSGRKVVAEKKARMEMLERPLAQLPAKVHA